MQTTQIPVRFTLHEETPISEYLEDGLIREAFPQEDGTFQVILQVDETLIESLDCSEMAEFFGLDSEFAIYMEVLG